MEKRIINYGCDGGGFFSGGESPAADVDDYIGQEKDQEYFEGLYRGCEAEA